MNVLDTYNDKVLGNVDRFTSLLSTNGEKIRRTIINAVLVIMILIVFGCFDFLTWSFEFSKITTVEYWTTISSKLVATICSFNIGINFNWDSTISRAVELKKAIELYDILIKQKDDGNWDYYVNHIFNKGTKKKAYIQMINKKIYRLNKISKDSDKILYSSVIPNGIDNYEEFVKELEDKKAQNKYCVRRKELEYLKSDEYIQNNLSSITVKYSRVDPSVFNLGIDAKPKVDSFNVKGNVGIGKVKASGTVALSMVIVSMFTTALVISINQQDFVDQMQAFWYYLLTCIVDAGLIIWNLFRGTRGASAIVSEQLTEPYVNRNKVLTGYIQWKKENNIKPTESFTEINKLIDEENNVVEMTKEEYEKSLLNK